MYIIILNVHTVTVWAHNCECDNFTLIWVRLLGGGPNKGRHSHIISKGSAQARSKQRDGVLKVFKIKIFPKYGINKEFLNCSTVVLSI